MFFPISSASRDGANGGHGRGWNRRQSKEEEEEEAQESESMDGGTGGRDDAKEMAKRTGVRVTLTTVGEHGPRFPPI